MAAVVNIASGSVQGADEQGTHAFKGIPYAAPPVGPRRLRPPEPAESWDGVLDATNYGLVALQQPMPGIFGELGTPQNPAGDDCLNLNVWTPDPGATGLPVLFWIHGGAFYAGSGIDDVYNGARFARDGVVCVTINYRLGVQGFWHLGEHFPELADSGNLGMLDQIAALRWVQDNIAAFGGDPDRVTIAGESAGGMSVGTLLAMPAARGLFKRAIPQSGAASNGITAPTASMIAGHMLDVLGVQPGDLDALDRVPSELLLQTQQKLSDELTLTRD
ncbi:MAG: carboxylesterase/lipase family protein, partial [Acidimicrobiales bacterium]